MEQYFATIGETMEGYGEFEAEALAFKVYILQFAQPDARAHKLFPLARATESGEAPGRYTSG
jgi:hypothetical protein